MLFVIAFGETLGQEFSFPNEVKGYEFYGKNRLEGIQLKVSSKSDITNLLGSDCDWDRCVYDENWYMIFVYLDATWREYVIKNGIEHTLSPLPKFHDRLWLIGLEPRKPTLITDADWSSFSSVHSRKIHSGIKLVDYHDGSGLLYSLMTEGDLAGQIDQIVYSVPKNARQDMFFSVGQRSKVPNN